MSDPQPELRWAPLPAKPRKAGKIWLIVGLAVAAVALVAVFLLIVLPGSYRPEPSPTPTPTATMAATATPTPSSTPVPTPTPTATSEPTPPPVTDPSVEAFTAQVRPVLDDAVTGLGYAAEDGGESAANDVLLLQQDAERLSDAVAPSSIADDWSDGISAYLTALNALQSAYRSDTGVSAAEVAAQDALQHLRDLVGI